MREREREEEAEEEEEEEKEKKKKKQVVFRKGPKIRKIKENRLGDVQSRELGMTIRIHLKSIKFAPFKIQMGGENEFSMGMEQI